MSGGSRAMVESCSGEQSSEHGLVFTPSFYDHLKSVVNSIEESMGGTKRWEDEEVLRLVDYQTNNFHPKAFSIFAESVDEAVINLVRFNS